jgi:Mor family transcriptional regulator
VSTTAPTLEPSAEAESPQADLLPRDHPAQTAAGARQNSAALLKVDIRDVLQAEIGMNEPFADLVSDALCRGLRNRWGGREIYVPAEDIADRNARIRQAWRGNNASEVMLRFGISKATLYRVLNDR